MVRLIASRTTSCDAGGEAAMRATWPVPMPRPVRRDRPSDPVGADRRRHERVAPRRATREMDAGGRRATLGRAPMRTMQTRRDFVAVASAAGAASLLGPGPAAAEEGPLETTTVR